MADLWIEDRNILSGMKTPRHFLLAIVLGSLSWTGARLLSDTAASEPRKPDVSRVYGRIQYVDAFPDYKVEVVDSFEDLSVQEVTAFPDQPGKWQIVDSFPDYKIQKVNAFGDFKIRYVSSFPGPHREGSRP